jgi:hypothetical protein
LVFWGALVGHTWYVQFQGVIIISFSLVLPFIFSVLFLWQC